MFVTNTSPICLCNKSLNIEFQQLTTLMTICFLEFERIFPVAGKIVMTSSVANILFEEFDISFTFRTITPITLFVVPEFMVISTESVIAVITGTNVENVLDFGICFSDSAKKTSAAFGLFQRTSLTAKATIGIFKINH